MIWTAGRNQQLGELIAEVFRTIPEAVPRDYRAVIVGGLPGADRARAVSVQASLALIRAPSADQRPGRDHLAAIME